MGHYRILSGVHRCVAAHRAGQSHIRAQIDRDGQLGPVELVALVELYSPKSEIGRWDRGRDFLKLVSIMADSEHREAMEPINVTAVSQRTARRLTRVIDVVVRPA
jgi:hypothetical protein